MAKLSLFVGSDDLIMIGRGWLCVVAVKNWWLPVVVGGGGEVMAGPGWLRRTHVCLWMVISTYEW